MLGEKCNIRCRHCHLTPNGKTAVPEEYDADDARRIVSYLAWAQSAARRAVNNGAFSLPVIFWGGEPLLYFDRIAELTSLLRAEGMSPTVITNGLLLTAEIVNFLNGWGVHVCLSNDGPGTAAVRPDVLRDARRLELIKQLHSLSIDSVIHAYNIRFIDSFAYWDGLIGRPVHAMLETLKVNWPMPEDIYSIPYDDLDKEIGLLAQEAKREIRNNKPGCSFRAWSQLEGRFIKYANWQGSGAVCDLPNCGQATSVLNLDMRGNVYACHGIPLRIGDISEAPWLLERRFREIREGYKNACCAGCEAYPVCAGGCPLQKLESEAAKTYCAVERLFFKHVKDNADDFIRLWREVL
jgi:radical SAM protein with 4Fe4S-binding SPASM domain